MKQVIIIRTLIAMVFIAIALASATQKKIPDAPVATSFDYTPATPAAPNSANMKLVLVHPQYATQFAQSSNPIYQQFADNMQNDFNEILLAKGFTLRGPYNTYDDILFNDKKESDLTFEANLDVTMDWSMCPIQNEVKNVYGEGHVTYYYYNGVVSMNCHVTLLAAEPLTHEKLWTKSIAVPAKQLTVSTTAYRTPAEIQQDPGLRNPIVTALNEYYQTIMDEAWKDVEPEEFQTYKPQVKELKAKKGY
jgi:hypothetical protein